MDKTVRIAVVLSTLLAGACTGARQAEPVAGGGRVSAPAPRAPRRGFSAPADGRLTAGQVEAYLAVRRRASGSREGAASRTTTPTERLVELTASAVRAADELGYDADEFRWVSARIAEAGGRPGAGPAAALAKTIDEATRAGRLRVQRAAAGPQQPASAGRPKDSAGWAFNRSLLERYQGDLAALQEAPEALPAPAAQPSS